MLRKAARRAWAIWVCMVAFGMLCFAAQRGASETSPGEQFLATWTGTWDGAGAGGGFELTLEKATDGALAGRVSVTGEPSYKATFRAVSFDGNKMSAKYDFPPDDRAEVALAATFDGSTAKGTWSLREKASGNEAATGTWTVTKK
jgi:hypothetical protein